MDLDVPSFEDLHARVVAVREPDAVRIGVARLAQVGAALEPEMAERCTGPTESYRWTIGAGEDARLQQLLNGVVLGLKDGGYAVAASRSGTLGSITRVERQCPRW